MSQKNVIVCGASGRMGQLIVDIIINSPDLNLLAQVSPELDTKTIEQVEHKAADVVIDFSAPEALMQITSWCAQHKVPLVSGTTGLTDKEFQALTVASEKTSVLWAPNMSLGVALMNNMIKSFAAVAGKYDFQLEEFHHIHKKDRPSGTGKWLQKTLIESVKKEVPEVLVGRGGGIFGIHKLWAMSDDEVITIKHEALNRKVFAAGAVDSARWLVSQGPGQYTINDVLGL